MTAPKEKAMRNLYAGPPFIYMIDSGRFWRCDHGYTRFKGHCWRCGLWHPIRFTKRVLKLGAHQ